MNSPDIPEYMLQKWQNIVNILAKIIQVPAALIMKVEPPYIEVFRSSESKHNPYKIGDKEKLPGLYCETVINTKEKLLVPNALKNKKWNKNPDIKLGMISYLGFPILWPNDEVFGTICVLDNKENKYNKAYIELLQQFKNIIETQLQLKESKDYFQRIHETIPDSYFLVDEKGTHLDFKGNDEPLFLTPEMLLGKTIYETLPEDVAEKYDKAIKKAIETERQSKVEYSLLVGGKIFHYEARALYFSKNRVAVFVRDITELKIAKLELIEFNQKLEQKVEERTKKFKESEEKYRLLIDNVQEGIWAIDENANTTFVNSRMVEILGFIS